ncbi:MAG TPA: archaeal proteasome endopeptidase complex subunit beta [Nitrososphaerales archaeon]|nr:archaeal proteasome endopeptidase complex subunit beta [Nitrososphaerales archaeon]
MSDYVNHNKLHGTTTVGLECSDGVVLATDTRATAGFLYIAHRHVKKLAKLDEHIAMTIAGSVADAQNIVDILRYHANIYRLESRMPMPVKSCARLASNIFFSQRYAPYIVEILVGGHDSEGPAMYNVDLFGSLNKEKFVSTGSGSPVAYGILESEFREGMSVDEASKVAARAIAAAIRRNAGTGDGVDVAIIDKKGYREMSKEEKTAIVTI